MCGKNIFQVSCILIDIIKLVIIWFVLVHVIFIRTLQYDSGALRALRHCFRNYVKILALT